MELHRLGVSDLIECNLEYVYSIFILSTEQLIKAFIALALIFSLRFSIYDHFSLSQSNRSKHLDHLI